MIMGTFCFMHTSKTFITICLLVFISGCASMKPADFEKGNTSQKPIQFFIGKTTSDGVIENRGGKPTARITTQTMGVLKDSII